MSTSIAMSTVIYQALKKFDRNLAKCTGCSDFLSTKQLYDYNLNGRSESNFAKQIRDYQTMKVKSRSLKGNH